MFQHKTLFKATITVANCQNKALLDTAHQATAHRE